MNRTRAFVAAILIIACPAEARPQAGSAVSTVAHQAQIEARVISAPREVAGSDGHRHLAYELRVTSFQSDDDPLKLVRLAIFPGHATVPLTVIEGDALYGLLNRAATDSDPKDGVGIATGRSMTFFLWLTLPAGTRPDSLRHQLLFRTAKGLVERADNVRTTVVATAPVRIGAPLRGGRWLVTDGPGNHLSHHWGSMVAIDGTLSIPQRFAIDWFGLDAGNHSLRNKYDALTSSVAKDWVGYGQDVLAVADGVVVDTRDGIAGHKPLSPQTVPDDLTARTLYGNFVVLKIGPDIYAHYAHLQQGSVAVRVGTHVRRGAVIGHLGLTGSAGAPHLHFHISDRPTFEQSEGLPFVIDAFTLYGQAKIEESFDLTKRVDLLGPKTHRRSNELPLDNSVVSFP